MALLPSGACGGIRATAANVRRALAEKNFLEHAGIGGLAPPVGKYRGNLWQRPTEDGTFRGESRGITGKIEPRLPHTEENDHGTVLL
jgi:hypothetical protein